MSGTGQPFVYYQDDLVTLYQGDCRDLMVALRDMDGVLVTDPPYGMNAPLNSGGKKGNIVPRELRVVPEWDNDLAVRDAVLALWAPRPAIVFASPTKPPPPGTPAHRRPLIWDKGEAVGMGEVELPWRPNYELIWVLGEGFVGHRGSSILRYPIVPGNRDHPTEKPVALMRDLIGKCPEGTVVDLFAGSGSTLRAAKDMGRRAIGVEVDPGYCRIAAERLGQEVLFTTRPAMDWRHEMDEGTISVRAALAKIAAEANGTPLTATEIVDRVLAQPVGLKGKTPRASVQAQLYTAAKKGELFKRTGRGVFEAIAA